MKTLLISMVVSLCAHVCLLGLITTPVSAAEEKVNDLRGTVWTDFNNNQVIDANEPVLANATLCIKAVSELDLGDVGIINDEASDVGIISLVTTDAQGQYEISGLQSGFYKIWVESTGNEASALTVSVDETEDGASFSPFINLPAQAHKLFMPFTVR